MLPLGLTHSFKMPLQIGFATEAALAVRAFTQDIVVGFGVWFFLSQRVSLLTEMCAGWNKKFLQNSKRQLQ